MNDIHFSLNYSKENLAYQNASELVENAQVILDFIRRNQEEIFTHDQVEFEPLEETSDVN